MDFWSYCHFQSSDGWMKEQHGYGKTGSLQGNDLCNEKLDGRKKGWMNFWRENWAYVELNNFELNLFDIMS